MLTILSWPFSEVPKIIPAAEGKRLPMTDWSVHVPHLWFRTYSRKGKTPSASSESGKKNPLEEHCFPTAVATRFSPELRGEQTLMSMHPEFLYCRHASGILIRKERNEVYEVLSSQHGLLNSRLFVGSTRGEDSPRDGDCCNSWY